MSALLEYWRAGGPLMVPLAVLCFAIWLWTVSLFAELRRASLAAAGLNRVLDGGATGRIIERVREWARERSGPVARVAGYAIGGGSGRAEVESRLTEARLAELPRYEHDLKILKAMVVAAPLLGLLGTVRGMIATFSVLATRGAASVELLAGGISEALVTTQVGLVVALPGLVAAYAVGRRLAGLRSTFDRLGSHLLVSPAREGRAA